jgi:hypothetical protein
VLGAELRACGVDFSFTPVLDLDWGESGVIGDRAFHRDARVVTMLAKSLMHGLLQAGVANCGKHFPGHGFVKADSHTEIPVDKRSLKAILADDAAPYGWLNTTLTSVMPAHVIYPKVDARPAGFSPQVAERDPARDFRCSFQGAIFSDDLSMAGARRSKGATSELHRGGVAALQAGCDMVLLCNESVRLTFFASPKKVRATRSLGPCSTNLLDYGGAEASVFGFGIPSPPLVDAPRSGGSGGSGIALFEPKASLARPRLNRAPQVARSEAKGRSNQGRLFFCLLFFWRSKRKVSCRRATPGQQNSEEGAPPEQRPALTPWPSQLPHLIQVGER